MPDGYLHKKKIKQFISIVCFATLSTPETHKTSSERIKNQNFVQHRKQLLFLITVNRVSGNLQAEINKQAGGIASGDMQGLSIAECCGGNTQGSGASSSDKEPLNNFIDRFCSLQLTGHTTPAYVSLQQPCRPSKINKAFSLLIRCHYNLSYLA